MQTDREQDSIVSKHRFAVALIGFVKDSNCEKHQSGNSNFSRLKTMDIISKLKRFFSKVVFHMNTIESRVEKESPRFHGSGNHDGSYLIRLGKELYFFDRRGAREFYMEVPDKDSTNEFDDDRNIKSVCSFNYQHIFEEHLSDQPSESSLFLLGKHMRRTMRGQDSVGDVPAGYTYFGQLIFHDLTWFDGNCVTDFNKASPKLDMGSILGSSPGDALPASPKYSGCPLAISDTLNGHAPLPEDLPRVASQNKKCDWGLAHIPDTRNDNFLPLAQMHMLAIKFYNALDNHFQPGGCSNAIDPDVKRQFILHFQSVVLDDYLERIINKDVYDDIYSNGRRIVEPGVNVIGKYELPIEFAAAAARFGHSMIRTNYPRWSLKRDGNLMRFMANTFKHGQYADPCFKGLRNDWITNWAKLFDFGSGTDTIKAAQIDTNISYELTSLPESLRDGDRNITFSLAIETLKRQKSLYMASAEQGIKFMNAKLGKEKIVVLTPDELTNMSPYEEPEQVKQLFTENGELKGCTPIWYYILKEAQILGGGSKLGPFGSRLVMESIHAAIASADISIFDGSNEKWKPVTKSRGQFMISDLIEFSTAMSPSD